jgi:hypothetical protein
MEVRRQLSHPRGFISTLFDGLPLVASSLLPLVFETIVERPALVDAVVYSAWDGAKLWRYALKDGRETAAATPGARRGG